MQFSTSEIERHLGIDADTIRTWRFGGHLDGVGRQDGGRRWTYTGEDVAVLAVASRLARAGVPLAVAFRVAAVAGAETLHAATGRPHRAFVSFAVNGRETILRLHDRTADALDMGVGVWTTLGIRALASDLLHLRMQIRAQVAA